MIDNSDHEVKLTQDLVRSFDSHKLRYIRTGGLTMAQNWQTAVNAVCGEYFIICSDKLLINSGLLALLNGLVDSEGCKVWVWKIGNQIQVEQPLPTPAPLKTFQGKEIWECAGKGLWTLLHKAAPRGMNSCIKTSLIAEVESRLGVDFCRPTNPDYVIGLSLAALDYTINFLDIVGTGFIKNADGNGMLCLTAPDDDFVKSQFNFPEITNLPLPFAFGTNLIYQDIAAINGLLPAAAQSPIFLENYFIQIIHTAVNADDLGGFGKARKTFLMEALSNRSFREKLSLIKTICQQEIINLFNGKFSRLYQIYRIKNLLSYALPPMWKIPSP